ncbi:MAG: hypothetical protein FJ271_29365 [Planctomycetes bacterium]|nr:hypothetical protein [Planctomycetota bacterium]
MKWFGLVVMVAGLVGSIVLRDVQLPLAVHLTDVGGPRGDIVETQIDIAFSAAWPMAFLSIAGLVVFLMSRKQTTD